MVLDHLIDDKITEDIILLTEEHIDEIYDLIWLVMPGYYRKRSFEMGVYFGIFKNNILRTRHQKSNLQQENHE